MAGVIFVLILLGVIIWSALISYLTRKVWEGGGPDK